MEKVCPVCGKNFESVRSQKKYCSPECLGKAQKESLKRYKQAYRRKKKTEKICAICGKIFTPTNRARKYCSPECAKKSFKASRRKYRRKYRQIKRQEREKNLSNIGKICANCGDEFIPTNGRQKYCSPECNRMAKNIKLKQIQLHKICVVCGKEFVTHSYDAKTCSPECSSVLRKTPKQNGLDALGKNKVIAVPDEELKVRVVSFAEEEYRFDTLKKAVNFLSAFTEFNTEECIELLRERKTRIGEYKFFYG